MREVNGSELLAGSDHEFVVNLYTVVLNRWPDEDGYRHYLARVEDRPELRRQLIEDIAASEEARNLGVVLRFDGEAAPVAEAPPAEAPPEAPPAPAAAPVETVPAIAGGLVETLAQLRDQAPGMSLAELAAAQRALAETLAVIAAAQAAQVERRLAALGG